MKPDRDHIHAQFGTRRNLLIERRFTELVEAAERFCGAPFTLCRCSAWGKDTINLTGMVRQKLWDGRWVPDSGFVELGFLAPADGRWFSVDLKLPLDTGHLAEIQYRLDKSFVDPPQVETTVAFFKNVAVWGEAEYGYVHHAPDEILQDTVDPSIYRSLTGEEPAEVPIDPRHNPGRSLRVGQHLITCRWLNFFGGELATSIGRSRLMDSPCHREKLGGDVVFLRLYDDPLLYGRVEHRAIQSAVRVHLHLDELAETFPWHPVERRPSGEIALPADTVLPPEVTAPPDSSQRRPAPAEETLLLPWAALYDSTLSGLPGEEQFFTEEARRGAGRVLEIGCGSGRITIPVARTGVPVVGIDPSPEVISHLRTRLQGENPALQSRTTLLLGDVLQLDIAQHGPFAAVFIPYHGINRFTNIQQLRDLLEMLRQNLQPQGVLVFNTFYPRLDRCPQGGPPVPELRYSGGDPRGQGRFVVFDTVQMDLVSQQMTVNRRLLVIDENGDVVRHRLYVLDLRFFFPSEIQYLLELTGYRATIYGDYQRELLRRPDQEVVVVAERI